MSPPPSNPSARSPDGQARLGPGPLGPVDWMTDGLCRDARAVDFFPSKGARTEPARRVCQQCGVRSECLAYALDHEIVDGVWGGLGPKELRALIRRRAGAEAGAGSIGAAGGS